MYFEPLKGCKEVKYCGRGRQYCRKTAPHRRGLHAKVHKGLFIGYDLRPGGQWSGDYFIVDAEHLANADSVHHVRSIRVKNVVMHFDLSKAQMIE